MTQNNININYYNPYCFSPISEEVYKPSWRKIISHDIPFSDGLSGIIEVSFEALTPIIVKEGKDKQQSVNHNDKYFIPGTSIKGMIRNVLEILSFSKMGPVIKDNRYSLRDLDSANKDYTLKNKEKKPGLLVKIKNQYSLIKCPDFNKISYGEIGEIFEISGYDIKNKSNVSEKYDLLKGEESFLVKDDDDVWVIMFTGKMQNKQNEYCLKIPNHVNLQPLSEEIIKDFIFIHEQETKSKSWKFWKEKIANFENTPTFDQLSSGLCFAPVFYTKNKEEKVESIGLAFLHRELYTNSIHDYLEDDHKTDELDLAQCVFGSSDHNLKGRVHFSPAFVEMNGKKVGEPDKIILGSPKPTFYPFYLKQDKTSRYASTFSDDNGKINGWKRYLVHKKFEQTIFEKWNDKVGIKIRPLPEGIAFTTKIKFHNLKPEELGALLSAISFHNNADKCFHLIGMAKPLGYGKLKLTDIKLSIQGAVALQENCDRNGFMAKFESAICQDVFKGDFNEWKKEILPIFSIASENINDRTIRYPNAFEEFGAIKKSGMSIEDFSPSLNNFDLVSLNKQVQNL